MEKALHLSQGFLLKAKKMPTFSIKLLDWYLIREVFIPLFYSLFAFILLFIVYDLSIHFSDFFDHGIKISVLLTYYAVSIPFIFVNATPIAVLMAALYCLGQLGGNNEITAFQANGVGLLRLSVPFLAVGLFMSLLVLFINENIVPKTTQISEKMRTEKIKKKEPKTDELWNEFVYKSPYTGRHWVGTYDPNKQILKRGVIREFRKDGSLALKYTVEEAKWVEDSWWIFSGTVSSFDYDSKQISNEPINKKQLRTPGTTYETPKDFLDARRPTHLMNISELKKHIKIHGPNEMIYQSEKVDLHYKIAFPFISLVVIFLGVPLGLFRTGHRGGGALAGFGISLALCLCYYAFTLVALALGKQGWGTPWIMAWLPNIVFTLFGMGIGLAILKR